MLVHRFVPGTQLYTWVERDNVEETVLSKETTQHYAETKP